MSFHAPSVLAIRHRVHMLTGLNKRDVAVRVASFTSHLDSNTHAQIHSAMQAQTPPVRAIMQHQSTVDSSVRVKLSSAGLSDVDSLRTNQKKTTSGDASMLSVHDCEWARMRCRHVHIFCICYA